MTLSLPSACSLERCVWKGLHFIPLYLLCLTSVWWCGLRVERGAFSVVLMKPQCQWALRWGGLLMWSSHMFLSLIQMWHWTLTLPRFELFFYVLLLPVNEFPECPQALSYCFSFMWSLEEMEALSLYRHLTVLPSLQSTPWEVFRDSSDTPIFWNPWRKTAQVWNPQGASYSCHLTLYLECLTKTSGLILLISYLKASAPDKQMVSCHCFSSFTLVFGPVTSVFSWVQLYSLICRLARLFLK